jgi:amidohydrolase
MEDRMKQNLETEIASLTGQIVAWRRDFHRHPEVAFQETRTAAVVREFLEGLGLAVRSAGGTGLVAVLDGKKGGKTMALRADMDALPVQEEGEKEYISQNRGAAHACGHDGHMAMMMAAVKVLTGRKNDFGGRVVFLFQPAEEKPPGGAKRMVEEGVLEGVDAVFGLHLWQSFPTGMIGVLKGPMLAQADNFNITVKGKGGHGAMPHTAVDPIVAAAQIIVNSQTIVSRSVDPLKPCVVTFGVIHGGTTHNIIPAEVAMAGTVRTFDLAVQALAEKRLREIAEETAKAFGASCRVEYMSGYPAVVNDAAMVDFATGVAKKVLGERCLVAFDPIMGGEDFAYYLQKVPGAFIFLGAGDGHEFPHHHPAFDIDEKALPMGVLLLTSLALEYLGVKPA